MKINIGEFLTRRAFITPELEGVVDWASGRRFTFSELNERANRVAHVAQSLGVQAGDRVAILAMNSVEFAEAFFGLGKIGAVIVPLNWRLVADELSYILKDSGTEILLYSADFAELIADLQGRGADGSAVRQWIQIGDPAGAPDFALDYDSLISKADSSEPDIQIGDDALLFIMYTSGTTGLPKGVMHSHSTVYWAITTIVASVDARYADRYSICLPMFHVGALVPVLCNIYVGITSILIRQFDPAAMWRVIEDEKITITLAVPAMLLFMLQVPALKEHDYSTLRWIMSGASPVPVSLMEQYRDLGIEIHQVYGLTESGGPGCVISPTDAMRKIGSAGRAFFHTDVRVVDGDGNDVAPGVPGEVLVRGQHVMQGYWNNPDATAETIRDGWLHTGDIALMDTDGFVTIHDRVKDMIISGGENVYPAEIENVILAHPGIKEVAVIGQPSDRWGESPLAVVVKADEALTEQDVLRHCDGKLARYKQPVAAVFIDAIPRNPTGKPLKRILREQFVG